MNTPCDVVHLSFKPPFVPGSYNRFLGRFVRAVDDPSQRILSYWAGPVSAEAAAWGDRLQLVSRRGLTPGQILWMAVPERWRGRRFNGTRGRDQLAFLWNALRALRRMRPGVIVCYDAGKLGGALRPRIDWPCRLVLAQRAFSYDLTSAATSTLYSLDGYDLVWTQTEAAYRHDRARIHRYEPAVAVLPNGVDTDAFRPAGAQERKALRARHGLPVDRPVVLMLGRLVPKKGAHVLVEAWERVLARVPGAVLWVVGGGEAAYVQRLARTAAAVGCDSAVRLEGAVAPEAVADVYRAADVFVFPSLCAEGQACALLEAMASGLPCIASDRPEARELYRADEVLFVPDPNVDGAFAAPIIRLLEDAGRRTALGENARRAAEERFSESRTFAGLRAMLETQLGLVGARS